MGINTRKITSGTSQNFPAEYEFAQQTTTLLACSPSASTRRLHRLQRLQHHCPSAAGVSETPNTITGDPKFFRGAVSSLHQVRGLKPVHRP
ncbi:hypothetical protein BU16DRAFT_203721 [Lophium mytilinum]|uniref:Uncharacterized protein n=1 Tax=Lophium mytilinum TaxID=390894 RepID=A0A6A6RAY1_9PEZI|nr:hypothetical protein BU16DRAFT_203721 [Lophium mytilinum]